MWIYTFIHRETKGLHEGPFNQEIISMKQKVYQGARRENCQEMIDQGMPEVGVK